MMFEPDQVDVEFLLKISNGFYFGVPEAANFRPQGRVLE